MTDQNQAAHPQSGTAREVIERLTANAEAHVESCASVGGLRAAIRDARALLSAPSGAGERLAEAAFAKADAVIARWDAHPNGFNVCLAEYEAAKASALAAFRASPEAVEMPTFKDKSVAAAANATEAPKGEPSVSDPTGTKCINTLTPGGHCAGSGRRDWYVDGALQACCSSCGLHFSADPRPTPTPARAEAVSERARLIYEGASRLWSRTTWGGSDEDVSARVVRFASAMLRAAEAEVAKGGAA